MWAEERQKAFREDHRQAMSLAWHTGLFSKIDHRRYSHAQLMDDLDRPHRAMPSVEEVGQKLEAMLAAFGVEGYGGN